MFKNDVPNELVNVPSSLPVHQLTYCIRARRASWLCALCLYSKWILRVRKSEVDCFASNESKTRVNDCWHMRYWCRHSHFLANTKLEDQYFICQVDSQWMKIGYNSNLLLICFSIQVHTFSNCQNDKQQSHKYPLQPAWRYCGRSTLQLIMILTN